MTRATVSAVAAALVIGLIGFAWQASVAEYRRDLAKKAREFESEQRKLAGATVEKEREARLAEEREQKFAEAIVALVNDDFLALTSVEGQDRFGGEGLDRSVTLLNLLNRAGLKHSQFAARRCC